MRTTRRVPEDAALAIGPVLAWRTWGLSGRDGKLRLRPTWGNGKPWPPRRAAVAVCLKRRRHAAPFLGCTCGLYSVRGPELMQRTRSPAVIGTVALWGIVVEHTLGFRAQLGYPQTLRLVCPVCLFQHGVDGSQEPEIVAVLRHGRLLPLCHRHRMTASDVGLPVRSTLDVEDVRAVVMDTYGVRPLAGSALERTGRGRGQSPATAGRIEAVSRRFGVVERPEVVRDPRRQGAIPHAKAAFRSLMNPQRRAREALEVESASLPEAR